MPIDRDAFDRIPDESRRKDPEPPHADAVATFLADHSDEAFTPTELRETLSVPRGSIGTTLARLEDQGQVVHRGAYWAVADESS